MDLERYPRAATRLGIAWLYKSVLVDLDGRYINGLLGVAVPYAWTFVPNGVAVLLRG